MTSFTTLVNIDPESIISLITVLSKFGDNSSDFVVNCRSLLEKSQTEELVSELLSRFDPVFALEEEIEMDSCIQGLALAMYTVGDGSCSAKCILSIMKSFSSSSENAVMRLRALVTLFNLVTSNESKLKVIEAVLEYALRTEQTSAVGAVHAKLPLWAKKWGLAPAEARRLLRLSASILEKEGATALLSRDALLSYFETYAHDEMSSEAVTEAEAFLASVIRSPVKDVEARSHTLQSLQTLKREPRLASLLTLLQILSSGSLADLRAFVSNNSQLLQAHHIDASELEHKLRLLTLCAMGSKESTVSYSAVAKELGIEPGDIECWVVEGVGSELMEAHVDQLNQTVCFSRGLHRDFGINEWKQLQVSLQEIRSRLAKQ